MTLLFFVADNEVEFLSTTKSTLLMKMEQMVPKYPQILLKNVVKVVLSDSTGENEWMNAWMTVIFYFDTNVLGIWRFVSEE